MGGPGPDILELWERGCATAQAMRGTALAAAATGTSTAAMAEQPIGHRDRELLRARRRLIGETVEARAACTECGTEVEAQFSVGDLLIGGETAQHEAKITEGDLTLIVRAPSAADLARLAANTAPDTLHKAIVSLCVVSCTGADGSAVPVPEAAYGRIAEAVEALDPLAAIAVSLDCPECGARFDVPFDPAEFIWRELTKEAERLLWEVDQIARVYHWSEAEILALTPARRRAYLGMALE